MRRRKHKIISPQLALDLSAGDSTHTGSLPRASAFADEGLQHVPSLQLPPTGSGETETSSLPLFCASRKGISGQ
jgi:hypothetical protein